MSNWLNRHRRNLSAHTVVKIQLNCFTLWVDKEGTGAFVCFAKVLTHSLCLLCFVSETVHSLGLQASLTHTSFNNSPPVFLPLIHGFWTRITSKNKQKRAKCSQYLLHNNFNCLHLKCNFSVLPLQKLLKRLFLKDMHVWFVFVLLSYLYDVINECLVWAYVCIWLWFMMLVYSYRMLDISECVWKMHTYQLQHWAPCC